MNELITWPDANEHHQNAFKSLLNVFEHKLENAHYTRSYDYVDRTISRAIRYDNEWALEAMFLHDKPTGIDYTVQYARHRVWFLKFIQERPELLYETSSVEYTIFHNLCASDDAVYPKEILDYILEIRPECLNDECDDSPPLYNAINYGPEEGVLYLLERGANYAYRANDVFFDVVRLETIFNLFDYGAGYLLMITLKNGRNALDYICDVSRPNSELMRAYYALGLRSNDYVLPRDKLPSEEECAKVRHRAYFRRSLAHRLLVRANYNEKQRILQKQKRN